VDQERWRQVSEIFSEALRCDPGERAALLGASPDPELRREVESLLVAHEASGALDRLADQIGALRSDALTLAGGALSRMVASGPALDAPPRLERGQILGRYVIRRRLGAGGMGEVYRGFDTRLQREVAIKILRPRAQQRPDALQRFEQEARAASALNHPNIITLHDIGEESSSPYIVMELFEGHSLRRRLSAPWTPRRLLQLAVQLAEGLVAAHEQEIVHGDLKPENILVNRQGIAKIVDFGLAQFRLSERRLADGEPDLPGPGAVMGTLGYVSPELLAGEPVDGRSDQFSLGAILYEVACRAPAFCGATPLETLARTLHAEPRPLAEQRSDLPAAFLQVVTRCLRKSPSERYASTRELLEGLRAARRESAPLARSAKAPSLVGRAAEMRQLLRMLAAAGRGDAQLGFIRGPAGIGKTRLAEELAGRARRRGARVAVGRCWQDGEAAPLWPWRSILRDLGMAEVFPAESRGEVAQGRFGLFVAVLDRLRAGPPEAPLLIVMDDAHLADSTSLLLARFLFRERRGLPLLLVLTQRDEPPEGAAGSAELLGELAGDATTISLCGLGEPEVGAYIAAAGVPEPEPELLRAVATVTQGNPLHLRSVVNQSRLESAGLEGGLEQAIGRLLEGLSLAERRLIGLAALLGIEVSPHELARVGEVAPGKAAESLERAAGLGLATELGDARFRFVHELVRQSARSLLAVSERLEGHARAAVLLSGHEPERLARRAHHALAAAGRSREDAEIAVRVVREVAGALRAADGFELAATLLGRAVEVHRTAALTGPAAALAVEWAESVLACGRLAEARPLFQAAARTAEAEGDREALARAALGLGGVWVSEHRLTLESQGMLALQRRALEALPPDAPVLRTRLAVRLAAEEAYRGGPLAPVRQGVDAARAVGDAHALAEALSLCHHALFTPEHSWRRLDLANELIAVAAGAGDGLFSLIGLCWRAADLFLLGEPSAGTALAELRVRADALGCGSVLFIVRAMEVMLAIRAGEFERAEQAARDCFELGTRVGDADALAFQGAQLVAIRSFQGREAELAELATAIASSPTLMEGRERAFASAGALFHLRAGRPEGARALLDELAREGLGSIPASSTWSAAMLVVIELATALGDAPIAQAAYEALLPYASLPIMGSMAVVCFGSAHRALGMAALTAGQPDLALEHLVAAVAANERLGHGPAAIQARAEAGLAYLRRNGDGDVRRGRALLDQALAEGKSAGMDGLVARWREAAR
jgi:hypothetical protein